MSDTPRTDEYARLNPSAKRWEWIAKCAEVETDLNERIKQLEEVLAWYETKVSECNRHSPEGDAARDALAKDLGLKAKEAKL